MRAVLPVLLLAAACAPTSTQFSERAPREACDAIETCDRRLYEDNWGDDPGACERALSSQQIGPCFAEHCAYDAEAAQECLAAISTPYCLQDEEAEDPLFGEGSCRRVYGDCDNVALAACVVAEIGDAAFGAND